MGRQENVQLCAFEGGRPVLTVLPTVALQKSTAMHELEFPETTSQVGNDSYMDDLRLTATDKHELVDCVQQADKIFVHAGMKIKKCVCSDEDPASVEVGDLANMLPTEQKKLERLL